MKKVNYTLEEIEEGLRLCESDESFENCVDCPFRVKPLGECEKLLMRLALRELKRLKGQVERFNKKLKGKTLGGSL